MKYLKQMSQHHHNGTLLNYLYRRLKSTDVTLYYLVEEGLFGNRSPMVKAKLDPLEIVQLGRSDTSDLAARSERDFSKGQMLRMLSDGCGCIGLRHKNEIVAYTWYDLIQCSTHHLTFKLKKDEAYLYGARTFRAYKGNSLAPYLRQKTYEHLAKIGRTRLYSITMFENTPSIRFKRKLNAKNLRLYLWIQLFGRHKRNILLRSYNK